MTAHGAFQFCKQYKRKTEFRRLCEIIRSHLANLNKYKDQRDRPDLSAPESLQLYVDTRFEQLKIATELELWQVSCESYSNNKSLFIQFHNLLNCILLYYAHLSWWLCFLFHRKVFVLLKIFTDWCAWLRKHSNRHWWRFTIPSYPKFFGFHLAIIFIMLMHGWSFSIFKRASIRT